MFTCVTPKIITVTASPLLLSVSLIVYNPRCLFKDPRCLFEVPRLTDCPVPERYLRFQTTCLILQNPITRFLSVSLQQVGALVVPLARQIPLPRPQPVDCSGQVSTPLHRRQQICSATQARPEEVLSLVVVEEVVAEVAATYSVGGEASRQADLVGALARSRVTILLVDFLALGRQDNKPLHLQAAPRRHLDSLASLRRANLQKQQRLDQVKRLASSAARAAPEPSPLVI